MRLPIKPILLLLALALSECASAQKFYATTFTMQSPYHSRTVMLDLANCDSVEIYTCPPTEDTGSLGQGAYTDIAFDHNKNLWYVTASGNLYRRNVNNDSSCEYIGDFTANSTLRINALVADDANTLYAAGGDGNKTGLFKFDYTEGAKNFTFLGYLPSDWQSSGDLIFYEHRLFLGCHRINHKPHFLVEVSLPDPSFSCYYMAIDNLNVWGAFSVKDGQGSKSFIINARDGNKAYLTEIDIPNKKILDSFCFYGYAIGGAATYYDKVADTITCVTDPPTSVYPVHSAANGFTILNPSIGRLRFATGIRREEVTEISLYDLSGRRLKSFGTENFPSQLDVTEIPGGMYIIRIRLRDGNILQDKAIITSQ